MSACPSHRLAQPLQCVALHLIVIRPPELTGANVHGVCVDGPLRGRKQPHPCGSFADVRYAQHLNYEFFGYRSRKDDTFDQLLSKSADFAAAYRERDEHSEAATGNAKLPCDFCNALAVDPANGACRICGHWNTVENSKEFDDDIPF